MKKIEKKHALDELPRKRISKLQWKKETKNVDESISAFIVDVLYDADWIKNRYDKMNAQERNVFYKFFEFALNSLAGQDYDKFLKNIKPLVNESTRQNIEEVELVTIANAIDKLTKEKNRFAARCEIADETGYSRKLVSDCLENYQNSSIYKGRQEEYTLMREKMITTCYQNGIRGDVKAARLFLEATGEKQQKPYTKNEQTNFIQINGYTITIEQLRLLPQEKQCQIQDILMLLNTPSELLPQS